MKVSEVMTREVDTVSPDQTAREAASFMLRDDAGSMPVVDGERLVGMITDRDIAIRGVGKGRGGDTMVRDLMSTDVASCAPDSEVDDVARVMSDRQVRRVVIVDADGSCVGIVAQADFARAADSRGEITDREVARVVERISEPA